MSANPSILEDGIMLGDFHFGMKEYGESEYAFTRTPEAILAFDGPISDAVLL